MSKQPSTFMKPEMLLSMLNYCDEQEAKGQLIVQIMIPHLRELINAYLHGKVHKDKE